MKSVKTNSAFNTIHKIQKLAFGVKTTIKKTSHKKKVIKQKTKQ